MATRKTKTQEPEAQETQPDEPEEALQVEEVVEVSATPLDIESRRLEHQRRINEGGK